MARILVIECDADIRTLLILLLQRNGHAVRGASNGARGVELIYEIQPDLIITELQLPILSGWELIRYVRQRQQLRSIPVIAMATHMPYTPHMPPLMDTASVQNSATEYKCDLL